ncbi:GNAT family N-acetyltransferase [Myxococcota bacterium]|nr:GNAT family N-acetyltransferase [Myxococcota bacterium]
MQGARSGGPHDVYVDPDRRRSLLALLDDGFQNLSDRIARAAAAGFRWEDVTEPFVAWEGDEAIGHVGVLAHRVRLGGETVEVAGVHAVVTKQSHRKRGVARRLLTEAMAYVDARWETAKLGTDFPDVYSPHGFTAFPLHRFHVDHAGGEGRTRALRADERDGFLALCDARAPVSERFASLDPGWLVGIDLALQRRAITDLVVFDALDVVADLDVKDGVLRVHELFARTLPPLADVLALAPLHERVELYFCPDRLAPAARPEPLDDGVWMARGRWPIEGPIGISRLAEH